MVGAAGDQKFGGLRIDGLISHAFLKRYVWTTISTHASTDSRIRTDPRRRTCQGLVFHLACVAQEPTGPVSHQRCVVSPWWAPSTTVLPVAR